MSAYGLNNSNLFAYCGNNPVARADDEGEFWNFIVGAVVGAVVNAVSTAFEAVKEGGIGALAEGKTWAKIGVSAVAGAITGTVAASGAGLILGTTVSTATGFAESLGHELIDNDGKMNAKSWGEVGADTLAAFCGGIVGGRGATYRNKYMNRQCSRFFKHVGSDGLKKAGKFYYKMTATYSKKYIGKTAWGIAKSFIGGKVASALLD